jgi:hypothetical protein
MSDATCSFDRPKGKKEDFMQFDPALLIPIIAIVFSLTIPIVAIIIDYLSKKNKMRIVEKAIEKGLPLEGLSFEMKKGPRLPYRSGMITLAVGLGVGIFAFFIGHKDSEALYPLLGLGSIAVLLGIALIVNDRINYGRYFKES